MHIFIRITVVLFGLLWTVGGIASLATTDANLTLWFFDFRPMPPWLGHLIVFLAGASLFAYAVSPTPGPRRRSALAATSVLVTVAVSNTATFFALRSTGALGAGSPIPMSLLLATVLVGLSIWIVLNAKPPSWSRRDLFPAIACIAFWTLALPLAQMAFFGPTDYRRHADAIVVLGARAYADGRPSDALRDRVTTAVSLYHQGLSPNLLFSGGPGDGAVHETESMKNLAISLGVPASVIHLDPNGLNTIATARNASALAAAHEWRRVLVVSHAYHLPRVKLACDDARLKAFTVPARETYTLRKMPLLMLRETLAWWVYWSRAALGQ